MARISDWLLLVLVNASWQIALVAFAAAASDRLLRRVSARYRHVLWVTALIVASALPIATAWRIGLAPRISIAPASSHQSPVSQPGGSTGTAETSARLGAHLDRRALRAVSARLRIPVITVAARTLTAIAAVYLFLLAYRVAALFFAWRRMRLLLRQAREVRLPASISTVLERCRKVIGGRQARVFAGSLPVPVTVGAWRPALILPERLLSEADTVLLTSALGHELAHVRRHDYLFNLLYEAVSFPLWFHPALHLCLRRIRQTRELRCDEIVTERLLEARTYAQSLVELAGAALPFARPAATFTVGIADADILEERIMTILKKSVVTLRTASWLLLVAALLFVIPCFAAVTYGLRVFVNQPTQPEATAPESPAAQPQPATQTLTLQTSGGPVSVTTDHTLKVGEVVKTDDGWFRLSEIDSAGQYHAKALQRGHAVLAEGPPQNEVQPVEGYVVSGAVSSGVNGGVNGGVNDGVEWGVATVEPQEQAGAHSLADEKVKVRASEGENSVQEMSPEERAARKQFEREKLAAFAHHQAELAKAAKITMDQAISIALTNTPGTVVEARLLGERGTVAYLVSILPQNNEENGAKILINGIDGSVMESAQEPPPAAPKEKQ